MAWISVDSLHVNISEEKPTRCSTLDVWESNGGGSMITLPLASLSTLFKINLSWENEPIEITDLGIGEEIKVVFKDSSPLSVYTKNKFPNSTDKPYYSSVEIGGYYGGICIRFEHQNSDNNSVIYEDRGVEIVYSSNSGKIRLFDVSNDTSKDIPKVLDNLESIFRNIQKSISIPEGNLRILENLEVSKEIIEGILKLIIFRLKSL